ncbi:MAG: hypothetical protein PF572_04635 [Patescibacteria group bacterium]|jgi:hypothetical protein|nr:hypothetical protein [Patescibacteria group bacterium]
MTYVLTRGLEESLIQFNPPAPPAGGFGGQVLPKNKFNFNNKSSPLYGVTDKKYMNPKTAITILLLILSLSVLTILMIVVNKGVNNSAEKKLINQSSQVNTEEKVDNVISEKTDLQKEIESKDYSVYEYPEIEKQKDEAKLRLEKLNALRGGSPGPTEEEVAAMSPEEKAQLEAEAQVRLDRLNELRNGVVEQK